MVILGKIKNIIINKIFLRFELVALAILTVIACLLYISDVPPVMAQSAAAALPDVVIPQSGQRILVFSPHPDDETIGAGGYIAQSIENGADVRIVLVMKMSVTPSLKRQLKFWVFPAANWYSWVYRMGNLIKWIRLRSIALCSCKSRSIIPTL
jgi:hypothetical protein